MTSAAPPCPQVLVLDEGEATTLDALAASAAIFGDQKLEFLYAPDRGSLRRMADELAALDAWAVIVVDVDHDPAPKSVLADAAEAPFPLVVLSDGRDQAIDDHALSVGAAACLATSLPAREMIAMLAMVASPPRPDAGWLLGPLSA